MTTFQYNAAYPGSGKTEAALRYAIALYGRYQHKALLILPTIALIKEQVQRAEGISVDLGWDNVAINTIFSERNAASVKRRLEVDPILRTTGRLS
jgi:reverse gyrase